MKICISAKLKSVAKQQRAAISARRQRVLLFGSRSPPRSRIPVIAWQVQNSGGEAEKPVQAKAGGRHKACIIQKLHPSTALQGLIRSCSSSLISLIILLPQEIPWLAGLYSQDSRPDERSSSSKRDLHLPHEVNRCVWHMCKCCKSKFSLLAGESSR